MNFRTALIPCALIVAAVLLPADAQDASGQNPNAQDSKGFTLPTLPGNALAELDSVKQKLAEEAIGHLLDNELPLRLDASTVYPTVNVLPGGAFNPKPLHLSVADMDRPLPPGDYAINALAYCTEYSVHLPGFGTAYELAPLQGKAADAISALLWRGTIQMSKDPQLLQGVSWAIQSGLDYVQMPKTYQSVIDSVIPEYKGQINGNFLQHLQDTYKTAAKGTNLPPLETILAKMGQPGQLALSAMKQQQILLRSDTTDQIKQQTLFRGQESGVYKPIKAEEGPWTERIAHVAYLRYKIIGGNLTTNNVIELRILPQASPHVARFAKGGFIAVGYGTQLAQVTLNPTPFALLAKSIGTPVGKGAQNLIPVATVTPPADCNCKTPLVPPGSPAPPGTPTTPTSSWPGQQLHLGSADVYTGYCLGKTMDGIMFLPKACPGNTPMHVRQFAMTTCRPGGNCAATYSVGCPDPKNPTQTIAVTRSLGKWYLDQCPQPANNFLVPDSSTAGGKGQQVINDEPNPNLADGTPVEKVFYDFLMCGDEVEDSIYWIRTGDSNPQMCAIPGKNGQLRPTTGPYQILKSVDPKTEQSVVCNFQNTDAVNANDAGLKALQAYVNCGH